MDWKNASDPRVVALAVIRLPAAVPAADGAFGGTVITNPGGPGGSGVEQLRRGGRALQRTLDKPGARHYEMLSFDPRGVGSSWPRANCLPHNDLARDAFAYEERGVGSLDGSEPLAVPKLLAMYRGLLAKCEAEAAKGTPGAEIMGFMSTPSVARDMVEIVDKIDEHLREEELAAEEEEEEEEEEERGDLRLELRSQGSGRRHAEDDVPRLQYVGYSYGTVLGNYFASLFPERVGRLILDGVVDAEDYSSGPGWITSTIDADNITAHFYSGCHAAGASACPLTQPGDKSGDDIQARVEAFIAALAEDPLPATLPGGRGITALSAADVRIAAAISSYSPGLSFRPLAAALADLVLAGNATAFTGLLDALGAFPHLRDACSREDSLAVPVMQLTSNEASIATRCADGEDVSGKTARWWREYVARATATSATFGGFWSKIRLPCAGYRLPRNWRFSGPFTTPRFERTPRGGGGGRGGRGDTVRGKPAAPLLFLSARLDPVTPLASARRMAARHPGAAVVVQESMGHCALGSARSACTEGIAREYMDTGRVPSSRETVCESDFDPWREDEGAGVSSLAIDAPRFPFWG